jgi:hypothetical protein
MKDVEHLRLAEIAQQLDRPAPRREPTDLEPPADRLDLEAVHLEQPGENLVRHHTTLGSSFTRPPGRTGRLPVIRSFAALAGLAVSGAFATGSPKRTVHLAPPFRPLRRNPPIRHGAAPDGRRSAELARGVAVVGPYLPRPSNIIGTQLPNQPLELALV